METLCFAIRYRNIRPRLEAASGRDLPHLGVSISNADLAAEAGVSEFHFIRLFKKATGRTPREHVTRLRVERACGLLRSEPERTLAWVAGRCGFSNASHLSRAFKASVGVTPGVFRKGGV